MGVLTRAPIDVAGLTKSVEACGRGAITSFLGVVRNHHCGREVTRLEYSAYAPMAEAECERILAETSSRWPVSVALQHRLGPMAIGEVSVAIAVAGNHRDEAFVACRYVIEELKRRVPIWKREYFADGTEGWVDPTASDGVVLAKVGEVANEGSASR